MAENRVLIWVTHLLGTGHLYRMLELSAALEKAGATVCIMSGGVPVTGMSVATSEFRQIPAVKSADAAFSGLVTQQGTPVSQFFMDNRKFVVREICSTFRPTVIVTELYPFGRRKFRHEIAELLNYAKANQGISVVCSVRDILQPPSKPERGTETQAVLEDYYDAVLVHGDKEVAELEESFPLDRPLTIPVQYTGYIVRNVDTPTVSAGQNEILVSAGGGAVGMRLFAVCIDAAEKIAQGGLQADLRWRILVGQKTGSADFQSLKERERPGLIIERARPEFPRMLEQCRLSISQAGYNTVAETLAGGSRCILIPFEGDGGEKEQLMRAQKLEATRRASVITENQLTADNLSAAIIAELNNLPLRFKSSKFNGSSEAARYLLEMRRVQS